MKYVRVGWNHRQPDEPVILYSELEDNRFEVRGVEVFRNEKFGYANEKGTTGTTKLGLLAMPELSEIAKDPRFEPVEISQEEFEAIWARRELL